MFGKVKRWLGIEGVKVELIIPDEVSARAGKIEGAIRFYSMHEQIVQSIHVRVLERYKRGRRKNKLVDEYTLGEVELVQDITVPEHEAVEIEFSVPFEALKSNMDTIEDKNLVYRGVVRTAKMLKGVRSVHRVEAEARVKGTALNPFDSKEFKLIR